MYWISNIISGVILIKLDLSICWSVSDNNDQHGYDYPSPNAYKHLSESLAVDESEM